MAAEFGYAGRILVVNLSSGTITHVPTLNYADKFIGGRGIAAKIYWDEVSPDIKALDAENPLIFVTGPLAGFPGLAGSRLQLCGKSPATTPEMFCYANLGGSWGAQLKFSGWDGVVIWGKSEKPVYLFIKDRAIEIRDASSLWGKNSVETREILKGELGSSVKVLSTGIAGEHLVPFATVLADDDAAGTSGFAAVMGSKKLKAVVITGSGKVASASPAKLRELTKYLRELGKGSGITPPTLKGAPFQANRKRRACYGCRSDCLRAVFEGSDWDKGKWENRGVYDFMRCP